MQEQKSDDGLAVAAFMTGLVLAGLSIAFGLGRWSAPDYEDSIIEVQAPMPTPTATPVTVFGPYDWLNSLDILRVGDFLYASSSDGSFWKCSVEKLGEGDADITTCVLASRKVPGLTPPQPLVGRTP